MPFDADHPVLLALVGAVFALGGFVKGVIGLGLPTVTIGILSVFIAPAQAAALLVVPSLVTNAWQFGGAATGAWPLARRLAPMLIGVCVGVWAGADWLAGAGQHSWASAALGVALVVYAALGLRRWQWVVRPAQEPWLGPCVGLATGLVTAATGIFVIPAVPYLHALGFDKDALVRALGLSFLVSTVALALALGRHGALPLELAATSLLALGAALVGMSLGQRVRRRVAPEPFRLAFLVGLAALGVYLAGRAAARFS